MNTSCSFSEDRSLHCNVNMKIREKIKVSSAKEKMRAVRSVVFDYRSKLGAPGLMYTLKTNLG